jgi:hypothetical protein
VTCLGSAPQTLADFAATIDRCAVAAGGPDWQRTALLGALVVAAVIVVLALAAVLWRTAR